MENNEIKTEEQLNQGQLDEVKAMATFTSKPNTPSGRLLRLPRSGQESCRSMEFGTYGKYFKCKGCRIRILLGL